MALLKNIIPALVLVSVLFIDLIPVPFGGYADQRFILLSLLAATVVFSVSRLFISNVGVSSPRYVWLTLPVFFLASLFLLLPASYRSQSFSWVEPGMYSSFFLAVVLGGLLLARTRQVDQLSSFFVSALAVACFFYGAMTINVYIFALGDSVTNFVNYIPWGFVNIRYWSHIATWMLPLLPLAILIGPYREHRLWRSLVAIAAALWWWIILMSSARGSALGLAFGAVLAPALIGRAALPWLRVFITYFVLGVVAWALLSVLIPSLVLGDLNVRGIKTDSAGRTPLFIEAFQMSLKNFPFGMGPQSWLTHEIITDEYRNSPKFGHPHNMYLMWAAEYGWLLLAGLMVMVGQAAKYFWAKRRLIHLGQAPELALPLTAFTASVSAALFHAGVSAVFMAPGSMLIGLIVLTLFWGLIQPADVSTLPLRTATRTGKALAALVLLVIVVGYGFWLREAWLYHQAMTADIEYYSENPSEGTLPRFWFHGNFPRHPDRMPATVD